jgi:hypothetical protein
VPRNNPGIALAGDPRNKVRPFISQFRLEGGRVLQAAT